MLSIFLFLKSINPKIWLYLAITAILMFGAYKAYSYAYNKGSDDRGAKDDKKYALVIAQKQKQIDIDRDMYNQSLLDASKTQQIWQAKVDTATQDANNAKAKLEILRGDNQRLNDSLHSVTSKANQRISLPDTPKTDITEYTAALSTVFEQCSSEYLKLATTATDDSISFKQVIDSYPQSK